MTVLILCHGNICRSPAASGVMQKEGFTDVKSAGFKEDGTRMPKKVRDYMLLHEGIEFEQHRSHQVTIEDLRAAEHILYMDGGQQNRLTVLWNEHGLDKERGDVSMFSEPLARYLTVPLDRIGDPMFVKGDSVEFLDIMAKVREASRNFVRMRAETPIVVAE